jgi:hypothetical protein
MEHKNNSYSMPFNSLYLYFHITKQLYTHMSMIYKSHKSVLQELHNLFSQPFFDSASHFFI